MGQADDLLRGAIDLHWHGYPEVRFDVRTRMEDVPVLELAREAGLRGVVLKSHLWPTVGRVYHLRERVPSIELWASITLNPCAGGLEPWLVEAAAQQGARVVWLPTWGAAHDIANGGFSHRMRGWFPSLERSGAFKGIRVTDEAGSPLPQVRDILLVAQEYGLVVSTGHVSPQESLAVARLAEKLGVSRLIIGHPLSRSVGASLEEMRAMAECGAYLEFTAQGAFNPHPERRAPLERVAEVVAAVGPESCLLTTDSFLEWPPPLPEFLRLFLAGLLQLGLSASSLRTMVQDNPARLLGLASVPEVVPAIA